MLLDKTNREMRYISFSSFDIVVHHQVFGPITYRSIRILYISIYQRRIADWRLIRVPYFNSNVNKNTPKYSSLNWCFTFVVAKIQDKFK